MSALREVTWRDIPRLVELETELFADAAWSAETWWAELAGRPRRSYVVLDGGDGIEGFAGVDLGGDVAQGAHPSADLATTCGAASGRRR